MKLHMIKTNTIVRVRQQKLIEARGIRLGSADFVNTAQNEKFSVVKYYFNLNVQLSSLVTMQLHVALRR